MHISFEKPSVSFNGVNGLSYCNDDKYNKINEITIFLLSKFK